MLLCLKSFCKVLFWTTNINQFLFPLLGSTIPMKHLMLLVLPCKEVKIVNSIYKCESIILFNFLKDLFIYLLGVVQRERGERIRSRLHTECGT